MGHKTVCYETEKKRKIGFCDACLPYLFYLGAKVSKIRYLIFFQENGMKWIDKLTDSLLVGRKKVEKKSKEQARFC